MEYRFPCQELLDIKKLERKSLNALWCLMIFMNACKWEEEVLLPCVLILKLSVNVVSENRDGLTRHEHCDAVFLKTQYFVVYKLIFPFPCVL